MYTKNIFPAQETANKIIGNTVWIIDYNNEVITRIITGIQFHRDTNPSLQLDRQYWLGLENVYETKELAETAIRKKKKIGD